MLRRATTGNSFATTSTLRAACLGATSRAFPSASSPVRLRPADFVRLAPFATGTSNPERIPDAHLQHHHHHHHSHQHHHHPHPSSFWHVLKMEGGKEAMEQADVVVFGGGSFATALAYALSKNHHAVTLLTRNEAVAQAINERHRNPKYLSDFVLPPNVRASTRAEDVVPRARYIVHAVPVQASEEYLRRLAPLIPPDTPIISSAKGLHTESLRCMSDLVPEALGRNQPMAFLSGPSFAKELMMDVPTAVVVASVDSVTRERVQRLFASPSLRVYTTDDVVGVEVGGALKNVFAIAAGMCEGLGLGTNTLAALVTRGCSEMTRLAVKMGARPDTLAGLSGIGDLMLTCFGSLSRNRTVGKRLGSGESLESILATMEEVAEGVATTPAACKLAEQYQLDLPIIKAVAAILRGDLQAREAVLHLMTLPLSDEKTW